MGLFGNLSERMSHIFSKLTNKGKLTELEVKEGMREIKMALLEADVNYMVVKDFIKKVSEKALVASPPIGWRRLHSSSVKTMSSKRR